ncbi:MAG TPA: TolC family protein [Rhodanobacteraceae bacterium]|nr:TolC family protein [Rhodanobacteraceae bacterium]
MSFLSVRRCLRASRLLLAMACVLAALPVCAANSDTTLSLDAATRMAVQRAPQVRSQRLRTQAARHDAVRAGRLPDPRLTVGINNLTVTGPQAFNAAAAPMTMRSIGLTQAIPSHAKRAAEKAVARAAVHLDDANVVKVRLAVRQAAAGAWVRLWAAQTERNQLAALQAQSRLAVKLAKARLAGGTGSATDVLAARSALVRLDNRITAVDASMASARAALQRWVGDAATRPLDEAPDFSTLPVPPDALRRRLNRQGPLLGWAAREDRAQARLALAEAGKHPDWSVSLMYGDRIRLPDMVGIQVGVSLPLFSGNRQDQDISARHAERDAVQAAHENARRAQRAAVQADLAEWRGDTRQVATYRDKLLPLAADRSRTALASYRAGGSLQPWLEARRDEIDTRIDYAEALAAWGQAWAQLAYLIPDHDTAAPTGAVQERLP